MTPRRLSDYPGGSRHVRLDELVGRHVLLLYAEAAKSLQFGNGVRLEFRLWDDKTGTASEELYDAFSFSPGVRRAVERLWGGPEGDFWSDTDGVVCQVVKIGAGLALA